MAIYHFSAQVISRSGGGNALAAAAYRSGEKLQEHDYRKKSGVDYSEILTPENAPEWAKNRESLWSAVEAIERRKDAQLCREINIALPLELKPEERQELAQNFCRKFTQLGMVADLAIHGQETGNPHAHIMLTMRGLTPEGFGPKNREWNRRELVEEWREAWAREANHALERAGHEARIDHRTLAAQGIDHEATIHQGKAVTALERKGQKTRIGQLNAEQAELTKATAEIEAIKAELEKLERLRPDPAPEKTQPAPEKTVKSLREEDKADKEQSYKAWAEKAKKLNPGAWEDAEKSMNYRIHNFEKEITDANVAVNSARMKLEDYENEISGMSFLAKVTGKKKIEATRAELKKKLDTAEQKRSELYGQVQADRQKQVTAQKAREARQKAWEASPEAKAYEERRKARQSEIRALERADRERERSRSRGQSLEGWER